MLIIDRYVLKRYILTLLFVLCSFTAIFVIVDLVEDLDKFIDTQTPVHIIMLFYVYYLPEIIKLVLPIGVLMAALFSIGQMARHNELIAMKASGANLYRVFLPVFLFAVILSAASFFFNESVVTLANRERWDIDRVYLRKLPASYFTKRNDIYLQDALERTVVIGYFDGEKKIGYDIDVVSYQNAAITERILAKECWFVEGNWIFKNGTRRTFSPGGESLDNFKELATEKLNIEPLDLEGIQIRPEEMNYNELGDYINKLKRLGGEFQNWGVARHQKLSFPFSLIVIVIFGMTLASRQWRGGTATGVGISIFLCFIYYSVNISLGPVLGQRGVVPPVVAAWLANILFGFLAIWAVIRTQR